MKFTIRKLNYSPDVRETAPATIAVLLFNENEQGIGAIVQDQFSTVLKRFPVADLTYLEALRDELVAAENDPAAVERLRDSFSEASLSVTLSDAQPFESEGVAAAREHIKSMLN